MYPCTANKDFKPRSFSISLTEFPTWYINVAAFYICSTFFNVRNYNDIYSLTTKNLKHDWYGSEYNVSTPGVKHMVK